MTEIMPFPENNILFYWAAPQAVSFFFCPDKPALAEKPSALFADDFTKKYRQILHILAKKPLEFLYQSARMKVAIFINNG